MMLSDFVFAGEELWPSPDVLKGANELASKRASTKPEIPTIAIVEDNAGDVFIMEETLREHSLDCTIIVLSNGEQAISYFDRLERDASASCPNIILLDLNLPMHSGHSVLARIRAGRCSSVPVVVVSSSDAPSDRAESRRLGATAYFKKPSRLNEFMKLGPLIKSLL